MLDSAFPLGTFKLVWAAFGRQGSTASQLRGVWTSKPTADRSNPEAKYLNFTHSAALVRLGTAFYFC